MTQIATIHLANDPALSPSGKAYMLNFKTPSGSTVVPVACSQSKIELGVLWVADWILRKKSEGLGRVLALGYESLDGKVIPATIPEEVKVEAVAIEDSAIKKGMFTVEAEGEKHRTFKLKTSPKSGKTVIGMLVGPNNTQDYAWFGFVDGDKIRHWKSANLGYGVPFNLQVSQASLDDCFATILGDPKQAGLKFARESKKCSRCGKDLTHPESLDIGLGPECSGLGYGASKAKKK